MSNKQVSKKIDRIVSALFIVAAIFIISRSAYKVGYEHGQDDISIGIENLSLNKIETKAIGQCAIDRLDEIIAEGKTSK